MALGALKLVLLIGVLHGSITLAAGKCEGVCVKMDECENTFGGINFVNLRFNDEDYVEADCPHYLEVCCDLEHVVTTSAPLVSGVVNADRSKESEGRSDEDNQGHSDSKPEVTSEIPKVLNVNEGSKEKSSEEIKSDTDGPKAHSSSETVVVEDPNLRSTVGDQKKEFGECGIRNPDGMGFKLANSNSNETEYAEFPWMMAILQSHEEDESKVLKYECGGSLIAPNVVLTAAHCVMDKSADQLTVRAGEWDTMTTNEIFEHQERPVSSIILHPKFNRNLLFHDIALLVVASPFTAADNVQFACLPPQDMEFTDTNCYAAGWGKTAFDAKSYYQ